MKRLVFDFDGTLYGEGDNQQWLELYDLIMSYNPQKIWLFSNGSKWMKMQPESPIVFEHITDIERHESDLDLVDQCIEHALRLGYKGSPSNAALVKRAPEGAYLIDDLAPVWKISGSNSQMTLTPEELIDQIKSGRMSLTVDNLGYLAVASNFAA
jgi:FMN phosphatase YigB (HAD superfamily)